MLCIDKSNTLCVKVRLLDGIRNKLPLYLATNVFLVSMNSRLYCSLQCNIFNTYNALCVHNT